MEYLEYISKLCILAGRYSKSKVAYSSSNGQGVNVVMTLERLADGLRKSLGLNKKTTFSVLVSKGQGNVPKIFWVSILPAGRGPSKAASVSICFGKNGEGIVAGLMVPKVGGLHMLVQKERVKTEILVDVDGDKEGTKYNNCFINPKEWLVDNLDGAEIQTHLLSSIELLAKLINEGQAGYAYFKP